MTNTLELGAQHAWPCSSAAGPGPARPSGSVPIAGCARRRGSPLVELERAWVPCGGVVGRGLSLKLPTRNCRSPSRGRALSAFGGQQSRSKYFFLPDQPDAPRRSPAPMPPASRVEPLVPPRSRAVCVPAEEPWKDPGEAEPARPGCRLCDLPRSAGWNTTAGRAGHRSGACRKSDRSRRRRSRTALPARRIVDTPAGVATRVSQAGPGTQRRRRTGLDSGSRWTCPVDGANASAVPAVLVPGELRRVSVGDQAAAACVSSLRAPRLRLRLYCLELEKLSSPSLGPSGPGCRRPA